MLNKFQKVFNTDYQYEFKSSARVNLIGEHIDYVGGYVFPCAISLYITAFISLRNDKKISLYSEGLEPKEAYLDDINYNIQNDWANYPLGAIKTLLNAGYKIDKGLNIYLKSEIPLGSGLSSSAALLDLIIYSCNKIFDLKIDKKEIAILARRCEVEFCGVNCGIMDQAAIALGKKDKGILLNCQDFKYVYVDADFGPYVLVLMDSKKMRKLNESKYNERVMECDKILNVLKPEFYLHSLCDLRYEDLDKACSLLNDETLEKRLRHIVSENKRTFDFVDALETKDYQKLGSILNESHYSLKNNYEVTGFELDSLTNAARTYQHCLGSRMTGAGFGGFSIALVDKNYLDEFKEKVYNEYLEQTGLKTEFYVTKVCEGLRKIK